MSEPEKGDTAFGGFMADYGMIFVLILLALLFSLLTIEQQHPGGEGSLVPL